MKYAWIEETEIVDGPEILVDGTVEILDVGDVSFDPPQFTQISQDPQVFEQVEVGTGNGVVTGLNRSGVFLDRELTGHCTPQELVWGMDNDKYKVVDNILTPLTSGEVDIIELNKENDQNERIARMEAIIEAQTSEGGSQYTVEQLDAWLDSQYDSTDFDAAGLAIYQLSDTDMTPTARAAVIAMMQEVKKVIGKCKLVDRRIGVEILK